MRTQREEPGGWWDAVAHRARSPWHSLAAARLQADFGARLGFVSAFRRGEPVGVAWYWVAGSARHPLADRLFARIAGLPDEPAVPDGDREVLVAILDRVRAGIRRSGATRAALRVELPRALRPGDLEAAGYRVTHRGVGVVDLPREEDAVDGLLRGPARRQVRKAERLGYRVEATDQVAPLLPLLDLSFARAGLPPRSHEYVRRLRERLSGEVLVARRGGRDVSALLWARIGDVGLNVFHGRADGDTEGSSNLLHRELLRRAVRHGLALLHTGDAALPGETDPRLIGITRFKKSMGFRIRPAFQGTRVLRPLAARIRSAALWLSARRGSMAMAPRGTTGRAGSEAG